MRILALTSLFMLAGCTSSVLLCFGKCDLKIEQATPQSPAEKIGGGFAALLAEQISGAKK
jgi:hypothetical protein